MSRCKKNMSSIKNVWAVICGSIRDTFELKLLLNRLIEARLHGQLDGIVISTWDTQKNKHPELFKSFESANIIVVELNELPEIPFCNSSYTVQALQLLKGIECVPNNAYILKCRTEFCLELVNRFLDYELIDLSIRKRDIFNIDFEKKIWVNGVRGIQPFFSADRSFFGKKNDILKMIDLSLITLQHNGSFIITDVLFFLTPFLQRFPIINQFFDRINYSKYCDACIEQICDETKKVPTLIVKLWAITYLLFDSCFLCNSNIGHSENFNFLSALKYTDTPTGIKTILSGKCTLTPLYSQFLSVLQSIKRCKPYDLILIDEDFSELCIWLEEIGFKELVIRD